YEELKEKAGQTADLESKLSKALEENEKLKSEAKQAEHEKELSTIRANVAAKHGITDPSVLAGDNEKQIGEYAEKLMKVFADMRSRGTVADQSARTGQAKAKRSSREDFVNAMSNTLL
ncbi:scaffolding protein, partial [Bifidobacterium adolescentis]